MQKIGQENAAAEEENSNFDRYGASINITKEALKIGKIPIEQVAVNISKGMYTHGDPKKRLPLTPRTAEILQQSENVVEAFRTTG